MIRRIVAWIGFAAIVTVFAVSLPFTFAGFVILGLVVVLFIPCS